MSNKKYSDPVTTSIRLDRKLVDFVHKVGAEFGELFIIGLRKHIETKVSSGDFDPTILEELNNLLLDVAFLPRMDPKYIGFRTSSDCRAWAGAVKFRDGMKCRVCGSTKKVEAHHIKSVIDRPDLRLKLDNGVSLCKGCHIIAHTTGNISWGE